MAKLVIELDTSLVQFGGSEETRLAECARLLSVIGMSLQQARWKPPRTLTDLGGKVIGVVRWSE